MAICLHSEGSQRVVSTSRRRHQAPIRQQVSYRLFSNLSRRDARSPAAKRAVFRVLELESLGSLGKIYFQLAVFVVRQKFRNKKRAAAGKNHCLESKT